MSGIEEKKHTVVAQDWVEEDMGEFDPGGRSLHLSKTDVIPYSRAYLTGFNSRSGEPYSIEVGADLYEKVRASKNGIHCY